MELELDNDTRKMRIINYLDYMDDKSLQEIAAALYNFCLLYTSPSPRDGLLSRMPSSA